MQTFISFVRKEFIHVLRDVRSLFVLIGLPVAMILIFGFALSSEVKESNIYVIDHAHDEASRHLIHRFEESNYFHIKGFLNSYQEIHPLFQQNKARAVIVLPAHFHRELMQENLTKVQLIADASDANTANTVIQYASQIIRDYQISQNKETVFPISVHIEMLYNPSLESTYNFVPGVMTLILILLSAMMTSVAIVKEKEMGTMELVLVSPVNPLIFVLSKTVPYLFLSFVNVIIILLLAVFVLHVPINGSIGLLLSVCLLYITTSLSLGLLISSIATSQQVAMFISLVGLLMPALIFSGFMFPIENMPRPLQVMSNIFPTRWFFLIIQNIMIKGLGWETIWQEVLVLSGMTIFFIFVSVKKFKIRL